MQQYTKKKLTDMLLQSNISIKLFEERILDAIETNLCTSIPTVASVLDMSRCIVQQILPTKFLHHLHKVQFLLPDDHPAQVHFAQRYLQ